VSKNINQEGFYLRFFFPLVVILAGIVGVIIVALNKAKDT